MSDMGMPDPSRQTPPSPAFGERLVGFLDAMLEGCQVIGPDWRYLYVNETAAAQGRCAREALVGRTMMEAYPGIDATPMFAALRRCMTDRVARRLDTEFEFPDGSRGWFELRLQPVPEGVFILSLDVTARRRAEARIEHLNAVLRGIGKVNQIIARETDRDRMIHAICTELVSARGFDSVSVVLTDETGDEIRAEASAGRRLTGLQELLGQGRIPECAREAFASRDLVLRRDQAFSCEGCPVVPELGPATDELIHPLEQSGHVYGFMVAHLPQGMGDDPEERRLLREVAGDIGVALHGMRLRQERDDSEAALVSTQEQLLQSQKLEAVGRLAGGVAHDFNNILAAQIGCCELIEDQLRPGDPLTEDVATIKSCAERAAGLTRQLLAFSRKQALQVEVLDLNDVVRGIENMLERLIGEDVLLKTALAPGLGRVKADPGQVEQVIMNLAVNARDAMPDGGNLTIETADVELDRDYARSHIGATPGPHVMLAISDTGTGMDEPTRRRLFEPFFTTKEHGKGTGLGLATVYGIVKQSGGNIWVYSESGRGTTFKIYLPRVEDTAEAPRRRIRAAALGAGERVLVVEDEPVLRELMGRLVAELGYRATTAVDGAAALALVERDGLHPDLLLTDVVMPGMSGRTLAERLAPLVPGLKVLYASGYTDNTIIHHGVLDAGVAFLQKPFTTSDLAAKIREVLDGA